VGVDAQIAHQGDVLGVPVSPFRIRPGSAQNVS